MAQLSNQLLVVTVFSYLAAMLGYLAEYSFGGRGAVARTATRAPRERELVEATVGAATGIAATPPVGTGAAAPPTGRGAAAPPASLGSATGSAVAGATRDRAALFGRVGVVLTVVAAVAHGSVLVTRGLAAGRVPWGNMFEFVVALSFVGVVAYLVLLIRRPTLRLLGLFVATALVLTLGFAGLVLYTSAAPLVPALNSYWLKIHVSAAALASGLFLVAFIPAALFLIRSGYDRGKRSFPYSIGRRLPRADSLERLSFRLHTFAFPIWTLAVICGAIWAEAAWGRYWGWDPKETWSFVSWVVYAGYLHARATPSVKRTTAGWIAVAAWATMLINLYVINFVAVGLHTYAEV